MRRSRPAEIWSGLACLAAAVATLSVQREAVADPYQFIESPAAILVGRGEHEIKADYAVEEDHIPAETLLVHYRHGISSAIELSGGALFVRFTDEDSERIAEAQATAKYHVPAKVFSSTLVLFARLRESFGDPYIVDIDDGPGDVEREVSRHADGGRDASVGILARRAAGQYAYTIGLEYMYAGGRSYGDFTEQQHDVYTLYFTPERHFFRNDLMVAIENRYTYWTNRGDFYDLLPQVRWEFIKHWIVESGVSIPVIGGRLYRYIIGFTYEY